MRATATLPLYREKLIPLKEMPAKLPVRVSYPSLVRWTDIGYGGVLLEHCYVGRRIYSSIEAFNRFVEQTQPEG